MSRKQQKYCKALFNKSRSELCSQEYMHYSFFFSVKRILYGVSGSDSKKYVPKYLEYDNEYPNIC